MDGTLSDPGQSMDPGFYKQFVTWAESRHVHLATGVTYKKLLTQIPQAEDIFDIILCCNGNSVWRKGQQIHWWDWEPPTELIDHLNEELTNSGFPIKLGSNISPRTGMVAFSVLGVGATPEERAAYVLWDSQTEERKQIINRLRGKFPNINATIGGQTSIDIYAKGKSKAIARYVIDGHIIFFGDAMDPYGNDRLLVETLKPYDTYHRVNNWRETQLILKSYDWQNNGITTNS